MFFNFWMIGEGIIDKCNYGASEVQQIPTTTPPPPLFYYLFYFLGLFHLIGKLTGAEELTGGEMPC